MNKILYILLFSLFNNILQAQTSYSEYVTISYTHPSKKIDLSTFNFDHQKSSENSIGREQNSLLKNGIVAKSKLSIYSNCQFTYLKLIIEDINIPVSLGKGSEVTLLIDKTHRIVYDLKKLTHSTYKNPDSLTTKNKFEKDSVFSKTVISFNGKDTATITFQKRLPKCLTSKIILLNTPCGIQKIQTRKQNTTLIFFNANSHFDFSKELEHAKKICLKLGDPLNLLFPD